MVCAGDNAQVPPRGSYPCSERMDVVEFWSCAKAVYPNQIMGHVNAMFGWMMWRETRCISLVYTAVVSCDMCGKC